jgi:hypothetical protein
VLFVLTRICRNYKRRQINLWNASIYDIPKEKIVFIHDDACRILSSYKDGKLIVVSNDDDTPSAKNDYQGGYDPIGRWTLLPKTINCIFLSPPWGGLTMERLGDEAIP